MVRSLFFFLVVHLLFHPLPGLTYFLCLAKESRQRKARPRWRPPPWIFVAGREGRQTRCAQTASLLYPPRNKNPRRHQGPNVKRQRPTHREVGLVVLLGAQMVCLFAFDFPCPMRRLEFLLQGGKREEACLSAASLPPLPPCDINSRSLSPHRARLSLLTFFGKTKKVSRPRQGAKGGQTTNA